MAADQTVQRKDLVPDFDSVTDLSIALKFNGPQPNVYGVEPAVAEACRYGSLVGDTREGGSCNFERYTLIPHCNGTHTESVGHITKKRVSIRECLRDVLVRAFVISVEPAAAASSNDSYASNVEPDDLLVDARMLKTALGKPSPGQGGSALIIRTLPNDASKLIRSHDAISPYFSNNAMRLIVEEGFTHLLVDLPSVDRLYDEGKLSNHRIFWNVEPGSFEITPETRVGSTITELIFVPETVPDGEYFLNIQIAPFDTDASPSRPILIAAV